MIGDGARGQEAGPPPVASRGFDLPPDLSRPLARAAETGDTPCFRGPHLADRPPGATTAHAAADAGDPTRPPGSAASSRRRCRCGASLAGRRSDARKCGRDCRVRQAEKRSRRAARRPARPCADCGRDLPRPTRPGRPPSRCFDCRYGTAAWTSAEELVGLPRPDRWPQPDEVLAGLRGQHSARKHSSSESRAERASEIDEQRCPVLAPTTSGRPRPGQAPVGGPPPESRQRALGDDRSAASSGADLVDDPSIPPKENE